MVAGAEVAADGVVALTPAPPDGGEPARPGSPGAHIDLVLGPGLVRQYSLCGDPADRSAWRIAVLREPDGRGGSRLRARAARRRATRPGARPAQPLRAGRRRARYLFIAGGIGITPILPMVAARRGGGRRLAAAVRRPHPRLHGVRPASCARYGDRVQRRPQDETGLLDLAAVLDGRPGTRARLLLRPGTAAGRGGGALPGWPPGACTSSGSRAGATRRAGRRVRGRARAARPDGDRARRARPCCEAVRGGRRAGALLLPGGHLRHLRDRVLDGRAGAPRLGAHRRGAGRRGHHDDLRLPGPYAPARAGAVSARRGRG